MKWVAIIAAIILFPAAIVAGLYFWRKSANKTVPQQRATAPQNTAGAPQGASSPSRTDTTVADVGNLVNASAPIVTKGLDVLSQWIQSNGSDSGDGSEAALPN